MLVASTIFRAPGGVGSKMRACASHSVSDPSVSSVRLLTSFQDLACLTHPFLHTPSQHSSSSFGQGSHNTNATLLSDLNAKGFFLIQKVLASFYPDSKGSAGVGGPACRRAGWHRWARSAAPQSWSPGHASAASAAPPPLLSPPGLRGGGHCAIRLMNACSGTPRLPLCHCFPLSKYPFYKAESNHDVAERTSEWTQYPRTFCREGRKQRRTCQDVI